MNDESENKEEIQPSTLSFTTKGPDKKKPTCRLSILSALLLLVIPIVIIAMQLLETGPGIEGVTEIILGVLLTGSIIGAPIIAIIAVIRIALSDGRLKGICLANLVIFGCCGLLVLMAGAITSMAVMPISERIICGTNLKGLGTAIHVYADEHDGQLPPVSQWCDVLIAEADVSPKSFVCPSSDFIEGESCYAINKYAAEKKLSELPDDMVLLFETNLGKSGKDEVRQPIKNRESFNNFEILSNIFSGDEEVHLNQWNQVGGPENLLNSHSDGTNVLLVCGWAGYIDFKKGSGLESLRWDEARTPYPFSDYRAVTESYERSEPCLKGAIVLSTAIGILGLVIIGSAGVWKYTSFALPIAIGASVIGLFLGFLGESFYDSGDLRGIGAYGSAVLGFIAAYCYVGILVKIQVRLNNKDSVQQFAIALGMVAGIICSTVLHFALLLIHQDSHGWELMLASFPFGLMGGALLGLISGQVVCKYYRLQSIEPIVETGETE